MEAGAVAAASAPSTIENGRLNPSAKYITKNTTMEASNASNTVITMFLPPFFLSVDILKNSPVLNAINASAISARKLIPSTTLAGIILMQYGPINMPAIIYPVTLGSLSFLVKRDITYPAMSITATDIMTCDTLEKFCNNIFFTSTFPFIFRICLAKFVMLCYDFVIIKSNYVYLYINNNP